MAKGRPRQFREYYVRDWFDALSAKQKDFLAQSDYSQSYVSNVFAGRKPDPGTNLMLEISEFLGLTVNDLYRPPPAKSQITSLQDYSPAARETLFRRRAAAKR